MLGTHDGTASNWTSVGLIKSYAESRITVQDTAPNSSNIQSDDPMMNIFDFSSEEQMNDIIQNLENDNDQPPYDYND